MALIAIDSFIFPSALSGSEIYVVYFDNETYAITFTYSGGDGIVSPLTELKRGRPDGDSIGLFLNLAGDENVLIWASLSSPYAVAGEPSPVDPIPPSCDLDISIVKVNESADGADDGQATVTATSTFSGVEVSIDNTTWFTAPHLFTGLVPANYTAYSRDSNGCLKNQNFTIEPFINPIGGGGLPSVEVSSGNISKWNAAFNPIVFNFQNTPDLLKNNLRIEIEITTDAGIVVGSFSPNPNGATRADVSSYLKSVINANDDFDYDSPVWIDNNRSSAFDVRYREVWDGDSTAWFLAPYSLYVTWSAKQLGDIYGGNMAEYVTFLSEPNPDFKAKFLTLFEEPTVWDGLPFDLSFIRSEYLEGEYLKLRVLSLDINGNPVNSNQEDGFLIYGDGYILSDADTRLIITQAITAPVYNMALGGGLGINRMLLGGIAEAGVEYFVIQLYTGSDATPNFITQPLTIKINQQCNDPYIYIKWLNTLGGWDYWRFGYDQVLSISTSNGIDIDRNVFDWENDETIAETISKNSVNRISFGAIVGLNKIKGLTGLHNSTKIQMLTSLNPYKWQTVTLAVGQFDIRRTKNNTAELRFSINLPQTNIQQQ